MTESSRTVVDVDAMRVISTDLVEAGESLRTMASDGLDAVTEDPRARCRSYAADQRNVPGQEITVAHEAAVESAGLLVSQLAATLETLGRAAGRVAFEFSEADADLAVDVESTGEPYVPTMPVTEDR